MSNSTIENALGVGSSPLGAEVELLDSELDEVTGGSCKSFTCGVFRILDNQVELRSE